MEDVIVQDAIVRAVIVEVVTVTVTVVDAIVEVAIVTAVMFANALVYVLLAYCVAVLNDYFNYFLLNTLQIFLFCNVNLFIK